MLNLDAWALDAWAAEDVRKLVNPTPAGQLANAHVHRAPIDPQPDYVKLQQMMLQRQAELERQKEKAR
jgi:hypothetical protein